jgi:hypothetical protein
MSNAVLHPEVLPPVKDHEPSWERARKILEEMGGWEKIVEFGRELQALRERYFRDPEANLLRGNTRENANVSPPSARGRRTPSEMGWQETVRHELGMTPQSALRAIDRGVDTYRLAMLESGKTISYHSSGELRQVKGTADIRERARAALKDVILGAHAGRAFAGVVGEGSRVGRNGVRDRADVDHYRNLKAAVTKLQNSLRYWSKLAPDERAEIETLWGTIKLPQTWTK